MLKNGTNTLDSSNDGAYPFLVEGFSSVWQQTAQKIGLRWRFTYGWCHLMAECWNLVQNCTFARCWRNDSLLIPARSPFFPKVDLKHTRALDTGTSGLGPFSDIRGKFTLIHLWETRGNAALITSRTRPTTQNMWFEPRYNFNYPHYIHFSFAYSTNDDHYFGGHWSSAHTGTMLGARAREWVLLDGLLIAISILNANSMLTLSIKPL